MRCLYFKKPLRVSPAILAMVGTVGCTITLPDSFFDAPLEPMDAGGLPAAAVEDLPGRVHGDVSIDFDTSGDFPIVFENTVRKDAQVRLAMQNTNSYHEEGYVDVELPHGDVLYGKMIYLHADRISSLHNGDFEESTDIASCDDTDTGLANTEEVCPGAELGQWFAETSPNKAKITNSNNGNRILQLNQQTSVQQFFRTSPGASYRLSFGLQTRCLNPIENGRTAPPFCDVGDSATEVLSQATPQRVSVKYQAHLSDDNASIDPERFAFHHLYLQSTKRQIGLKLFEDRQAWRGESVRLRTLDCDDHQLYEANAVVHDASVVQSFCDSDFTDGGVSDEGLSLRYGALSFGVSWYGNATYNGYYAGIDNVFLDRENQIEIELISLGGRVVQSSTLDTGFRVESAERIERIRIWLRTDKDEDSPSLSQLHIVDATPLGITIAEQPRAVFDKSRIGLSGALPPKADWDDASLARLRSYCLNTLDDDSEPAGADGGVGDNTVQLGSDAAPHCWDFLSDHGAARIRTFFPIDALDFAVNEDGDDHDVVIQNTAGYERTLNRFIEMVDRGLDVLLLLMPLRQGASPNVFSEGLNVPSDFYADPIGTDGRSGDAQIRHLNALLSAHVASLFDGQQSHASGSTSSNLPLIKDFETFNEINISSIDWTDASGLVDLQNESCQAVAEVRPDANISSSGLSAGDAFFPTEYVLEHLGDLDETSFTHNNFHPYAQGGEPPENIGLAWLAHWEAVNDAFPNNTWGSKGTYFGEYGFSHFKYDPYCYLNNQTGKYETASSSMQKWVRGYGDSAFSKLVARATLKALQQPVDAVFYWSAFTNGDEAYGGDYACWKRHDTLNHHLFQEAENLEFTSTEQSPSVFQANDAGEVWLRLASHLGGLNPHSATLERLGNEPTRPDEHYYAAAFSAGEERYLAVWWYKNYNYGSLKTDSNSAFLNYIAGTMDDGFEEKRTHNLVLQQNISEVERATLIDLQSGVETELDVERDEQDQPVLRQVPVGEMPTLIRLH